MNLSTSQDLKQRTFQGGGLSCTFDLDQGTLCALKHDNDTPSTWTDLPSRLTIRDDRHNKCFDERDLSQVSYQASDHFICFHKYYLNSNLIVIERFEFTPDAITWNARLELPKGELRSCAIQLCLPWPTEDLRKYKMKIWAPKTGMPTDLCRMSDTRLEHGEATSGIAFPAMTAYEPKRNTGLLVAVPFALQTPRAGFEVGLRTLGLETIFDWLALSPQQSPEVSLVLRATEGDWRPALGWLTQRYHDYFQPRSENTWTHWGGTVAGNFDLPEEEAQTCASLGLGWYEIHRHFQAYGNYHPENTDAWPSGETCKYDEHVKLGTVTVDTIRRTIDTLHRVNAGAMLYIQVGHDADPQRLPQTFLDEQVEDTAGRSICTWPGTLILNADPENAFGKDITRQIDGMAQRYPEMDGVFLDQACYNFQDFAHDDGITAIDNRPCYMTGQTYLPHLEHLSRVLHPQKMIIGNGPHAIHVMKYIDAFIVEVEDWLIEQLQYNAPFKPMYFLMARTGHNEKKIEQMFQQCLIHAAGFTSYAHAAPYKAIYDRYMPLIAKLRGRQWVFEANPLSLPIGFTGNIYHAPNNHLLIPIVKTIQQTVQPSEETAPIGVNTQQIQYTNKVLLHNLDGSVCTLAHHITNDTLQFDIPETTVAALAEVVIHEN